MIDLTTAKIGDKFYNRRGLVCELIDINERTDSIYPYRYMTDENSSYRVTHEGYYLINQPDHILDLVAPVRPLKPSKPLKLPKKKPSKQSQLELEILSIIL